MLMQGAVAQHAGVLLTAGPSKLVVVVLRAASLVAGLADGVDPAAVRMLTWRCVLDQHACSSHAQEHV